MENKKIQKYNILMIILGLLIGPFEVLVAIPIIVRINIPFIKVPFIEGIILLGIFSIFIRIMIHFIQIPIKDKINRNLPLYIALISITLSFLILWSIEMKNDPERNIFIVLMLTIPYVIVQIPFLIPLKGILTKISQD